MAEPARSGSENGSRGAGGRALGRYDVNLLLFLLLVVGLTLWFWLHLEPVVTQASMLGGTVGLVAIWKSLRSWFDWAGDRDTQTLTRRFLGTRPATEYLGLGLVALVALYASTSSIYVVYAGASAGQAEFEVEVYDENGFPYLAPLAVRSSDRLAGRPFFLVGRRRLEFRIVDPLGFEPLGPRSFFPGLPLRVRVPEDFQPSDRVILRVVPDIELANQLPDVRDRTEPSYRLLVGKPGEVPAALGDFRRQTVYAGGSERDLRWFVSHHDPEAFREELLLHLALQPELTERQERAWMARWVSRPRLLPGAPLRQGEAVSIRVEELDAPSRSSETTITLRGDSDEGIETVFLRQVE